VVLALALLVACAGPAAAPSPTAPAAKPAATSAPAAAAQPTSAPAAKPAATTAPAAPAAGGNVLFHSSQFTPVAEAEKMRTIILKNFQGKVEFAPQDTAPYADIPLAQAKAGKMEISVIGGLHGDFPPFIAGNVMEDMSPLLAQLGNRKLPQAYVDLGKMGTTDKQYYIPWMQATYIMVANKKALPHLPQGADINALTFDQLKQWGANIQKATGQRALGFPAGPKGLIHRFWQGHLYPSYTGTAVGGFKGPEAVKMWTDFKDLWQYVNPASVNYDFMQEPLRSGEVWVAWDHVARFVEVLKEKPDDYVAFPSPAGPKGRGFMPVIAGLGITKGAPNKAGAEQLIQYMLTPETQIAVLRELAFFPVTDVQLPADLPAGVRMEADAVAKQSASKDALPSLLPVGLGTKGGEWNKVYNDTFTRIVLKNEDITKVLTEQGQLMQTILNDTKAACWPPDAPSQGPCQVK
jgi:multiple sugar transport system substrate-binding protein